MCSALANCARWFLFIPLVVGATGCAGYIGERIVRAPNVDQPEGIFGERFDKAWESRVAHHFLVDQTRIRTREDGTALHVAILPAGNYPHRFDFERDERGFSMDVQIGMPVGPPREPAKGTIVALHGWQLEHRAMLYHAMHVAARGWDVVLYDQRGHGLSSGEYVTFGEREAGDLRAIVNWASSREQFTPPLVLFGTSMGGSTALMAATEIQPGAIVVVAPYARLEGILSQAIQRFAPFFLRPFLTQRRVDEALAHAQRLTGVQLTEVAPIDMAERVDSPTLLIHSLADRVVPIEHARQLHQTLPNSTLHTVENHSHEELLTDRDAVLQVMIPWLDEVLERGAQWQRTGDE